MGNHCYNADNAEKYHDNEAKDQPSSSYAIEIIDPKEIPCDFSLVRTIFNQEKVTEPDWYQAYQCVKIDAFFLIKRYDLFYRGEWKKGVPYGFGEVVTRDGEYFKGFFQEGVARGPKCIFMQSSETYYIGSVERNQRHGRGRFIDRGYQFEGEWVNNLPHGTGNEVFANGDKYYGQFVLGKRHGEGEYIWRSGQFEIYRGSFRNNEMNREGYLKCRDRRTWKGTFSLESNFLIQKAECQLANKTFEGVLVDGKPDKTFTINSKEAKDKKYILNLSGSRYNGRIISEKQQMVFQDKILSYYDANYPAYELSRILQVIEESYQNCKRHSQALQKMNRNLDHLQCTFWKQNEGLQGIAIVPICGKLIKVDKKTGLIIQ